MGGGSWPACVRVCLLARRVALAGFGRRARRRSVGARRACVGDGPRRRKNYSPRAPQASGSSVGFHSHALARPVRPHLSHPTRPRPSQASQRRGNGGGDGGGVSSVAPVGTTTPGSAKPSRPRPRHDAHVTVVEPKHVAHLRGRSHAFASGTATTGSRRLRARAAVAVEASTPLVAAVAAVRTSRLGRRRGCSASGVGLVAADAAAAGIEARMIWIGLGGD